MTALRLVDRALDLVFPPRCVSCGAFGAFICETCSAKMTPAAPPRCSVCWMPAPALSVSEGPVGAQRSVRTGTGDSARGRVEGNAQVHVCPRCRHDRPAFEAARTAFVYDGPARDAVHALKFDGVSAVAPLIAGAMARTLLDWSPPLDAIVPVPLSARRKRSRGYNQSELLARHIARATGLPVAPRALVRRADTAPQARQQDEKSRRANVVGAFAAGRAIPSGGILLVDDVLTTGATLVACARALLAGGSGPVFALTYARED